MPQKAQRISAVQGCKTQCGESAAAAEFTCKRGVDHHGEVTLWEQFSCSLNIGTPKGGVLLRQLPFENPMIEAARRARTEAVDGCFDFFVALKCRPVWRAVSIDFGKPWVVGSHQDIEVAGG